MASLKIPPRINTLESALAVAREGSSLTYELVVHGLLDLCDIFCCEFSKPPAQRGATGTQQPRLCTVARCYCCHAATARRILLLRRALTQLSALCSSGFPLSVL